MATDQRSVVALRSPAEGGIQTHVQVVLHAVRQEDVGAAAPGTVTGNRHVDLGECFDAIQRLGAHVDHVVTGHLACGDLLLDDIENTVELGRRGISVAMVQQVVGVGQQLQGAVALFHCGRFGDVLADVQHVADLAERHQEFDQADFTAVFALSGANHAHLGVGGATQEAANAGLTNVFVNDVGRLGLLQAVEQGEVFVLLHGGLHCGIQRLDAQSTTAVQSSDVGLIVAGLQGLGQVAQALERAALRGTQSGRATRSHVLELLKQSLSVH
ncbi:hypothetical protein D3C86_1139870 [compost metagenome]